MVTEMTKYDFILMSGDADAFLKKLQEVGLVDITRSVTRAMFSLELIFSHY